LHVCVSERAVLHDGVVLFGDALWGSLQVEGGQYPFLLELEVGESSLLFLHLWDSECKCIVIGLVGTTELPSGSLY
jgi:hypothetical protein